MLQWRGNNGEPQSNVSADFERALTREILRTELLRVRTILATLTVLLTGMLGAYALLPRVFERIWHGQLPILPLLAVFLLFAVFELSVLRLIGQRLAQGRDVPHARRYLGALIETSLPTMALYLQMRTMGPAQALAYVVPLIYFIFIILSTLRLDFWLSTFTGFVAAAELFAMAMLYRPAQFAGEPAPDLAFPLFRGLVILICGMLAGAVGMQLRRQFEASILAATARDRITNLFGQHVSPQVVERTSRGVRVLAPAVKLRKSTNITATRRISLSVPLPSAISQGIHRDRRHREFCREAGSAQQGFQFPVPDLGCRSRGIGSGLRRGQIARRGRDPWL
jgi:adenylate cyclase